ncbi:MAG: long-chain fatty acid--CoA ligase, partial [Proteobacteria bacterium]|nr:long-chain fatty acid--CoA ligase [Pseudomonadota bacterium]
MRKKFFLKELSRYRVGTYADIVYRNALLYSDGMAFKCGEERISFSEFNSRVNRVIHGLHALGVG